MKKFSFLLIIVVLAVSANAFGAGEIKWFTLAEGMDKAKVGKKPMIVDFFFGKGCPRCEALEKGVYGDPSIAKKIMDDFIPIRVDLTGKLTSEEEQLGNKFEFKKDCMLLFLDYEGNIIKDPLGKKLCFTDTVEPEWFIKYLDMVLKQKK